MKNHALRQNRTHSLESALQSRILVLDGAMGTALQNLNLTAEDFGGPELEGCNENLVLTRPEMIRKIHEQYLEAGADIVETNTFGATPLVLDEYGLGTHAEEINRRAVELAREACDRFSTPEKPRFVAGSIGPTTKAISVTGGIHFDQLVEHFYVQSKALTEAGADYLLLETCQDTRNIKAALLAIDRVFADLGYEIPVAVSGTIEPMGTMLAGQSIEALVASLAHRKLLYLGLNCATGPEFMTDHIRSLAKLSPFRVACVPNAGLPDENGCYLETPSMVAKVLDRFIDEGWINVVGGCCGTHSGHIHSLSDHVTGKKPRVVGSVDRSFLSGVDYLEITDEARPVIVGERTNVIGSKKFKTLICGGLFEEASDIARAQIRSGAQIVDVCLANPDRDELDDMKQFLEISVKKVRAPLMIDSTDEKVIEMALTYSQGKAIINSINLEDGEERFEKVVPLAKRFGAALVVGTIDDDAEQGMGVSRARKLEIARRSYRLLTEKYGVSPYDIYWDPLVFPCATGDAQYIGSAVETIEGLRLLKKEFPLTRSVLGISNVSFGLPPAGREVLNSVFLYHCVQAGLDLAIVNSEKLERYASIPEHERKLAEDLLYNRGADPIAAFAAHFRNAKVKEKPKRDDMPLAERLSRYIIEGSKDGLVDDLNLALKDQRPLDIINGPLMKGMDEVGRLFNSNQLIVAEVLQSAEAMKAAVSHLEPFMEKSDSATRGKVLLATVKGDVHDIGKNLVEIILSNNGFNVINLGIKVPPEQLISAIRQHSPDIVGLSGLLVKSAQQMVVTADDFSKAGVSTPILVGGAALSENFVDRQIAKAYTGTVAYASDAMHGLELAKTIVDAQAFDQLKARLSEKRAERERKAAEIKIQTPEKVDVHERSPEISTLTDLPSPENFDRHVMTGLALDPIFKFINPLMLYGRHLGLPGSSVRRLDAAQRDRTAFNRLKAEDEKAFSLYEAVEDVKQECREQQLLRPSVVYRFFHAAGDVEKIMLFESQSSSKPDYEFSFPRQKRQNGLALNDYVHPLIAGLPTDSVALFVVTAGQGVREIAERYKQRGDYLKSHIIQALALETAEATAEWMHAQIRRVWGFPDSPHMTMMERFQAKYRGKRYSFGYPACPRLDDQATLFRALNAKEIGVELTDGFMMDPEASVSAIVFHHPQATYFSVGQSHDNR